MDNIFKEIGRLQEEYESLVKSARKELDIPEIIALFEEKR